MATQPSFDDRVVYHAQAWVVYCRSRYGPFLPPVIPPCLSEEGSKILQVVGAGHCQRIHERLISERGYREWRKRDNWLFVENIARAQELAKDIRLTKQMVWDCYQLGYESVKESDTITVSGGGASGLDFAICPTFADLIRAHAQEFVDQQLANGDSDRYPGRTSDGRQNEYLELLYRSVEHLGLIHRAANLGWFAGWVPDEASAQCYRDEFDRLKRLSIRDPEMWEVIEDCFQIGWRAGFLWRPSAGQSTPCIADEKETTQWKSAQTKC